MSGTFTHFNDPLQAAVSSAWPLHCPTFVHCGWWHAALNTLRKDRLEERILHSCTHITWFHQLEIQCYHYEARAVSLEICKGAKSLHKS